MKIIIDPPISELLKKTENRFTLCIFAAKRARQLLDGATCYAKSSTGKPVTNAINEIDQNKIHFKKAKKL